MPNGLAISVQCTTAQATPHACALHVHTQVLKYADNIARVYAHAIAMMVTMGLSTQLFHAPITPQVMCACACVLPTIPCFRTPSDHPLLFRAPIAPQLVLAFTLVATSTLQYNLPKSWLVDEDVDESQVRARACASFLPSLAVHPSDHPLRRRGSLATPPAPTAPRRTRTPRTTRRWTPRLLSPSLASSRLLPPSLAFPRLPSPSLAFSLLRWTLRPPTRARRCPPLPAASPPASGRRSSGGTVAGLLLPSGGWGGLRRPARMAPATAHPWSTSMVAHAYETRERSGGRASAAAGRRGVLRGSAAAGGWWSSRRCSLVDGRGRAPRGAAPCSVSACCCLCGLDTSMVLRAASVCAALLSYVTKYVVVWCERGPARSAGGLRRERRAR